MTVEANSGQIEYWNSAAGEKWAVNQERLDRQLSLVADRLFERSAIQPGERIIDIGCGTGASALRAAQAVGPNGHVFGVDISQPMLDLAKSRAGGMDNLRLEIADAQNHDFVPGARDLLQSRFGVMFFADPIAAFANLLTALRPGGRLSFVCWAAMADNPWFMTPRNAAAYVTGILKSAGFGDVRVDTEACDLIGGDSAANTAAFAVNVGPAARILKLHSPSPETIAAITADVEAEMVPYLRTEGVRVPAKLNFVSAERP